MSSNSIYPYVYKIVDKTTNEFYIGSRHKNVALGLTPEEDFLIEYFTSSKTLEPLLRENPLNFECSIIFRSGEPEDAYWYEQLMIRENIKNTLCLNRHFIDPDDSKQCFSTFGNKHSDATRKKMSKSKRGNTARLGSSHTEISRIKMSKSMIGNSNRIGKHHTVESKLKIASRSVGRTHSENAKMKMSKSHQGKKHPTSIVTCPHCSKTGSSNNMMRYHFDKCKSLLFVQRS